LVAATVGGADVALFAMSAENELNMATKTLITVEEFLRLPESVGNRDVRYELVEGELITVSPGMLPHNLIRDAILTVLRAFVMLRKLGTVVSEQAFHLFASTVRVPDVAFIRSGRSLASDAPIEGAPDLAVEVVSPTNTARELDQRISDYFAAGCHRVWVVYPEDHEIYIHGLAGVTRRRGDDLLEDAELLPGLALKIPELFVQE
jgi:Uma2 family endonuclease